MSASVQEGVVTLPNGIETVASDYARKEPHELSLKRGVAKYDMPVPRVGEIVVWHRTAKRMRNESPQPAVVIRINSRSIDIQFLGSATGKNTVAHIDDPRCNDRDFIGDNGAWESVSQNGGPTHAEFNKYKEQTESVITQLGDRIEGLQAQLSELNRKLTPKK